MLVLAGGLALPGCASSPTADPGPTGRWTAGSLVLTLNPEGTASAGRLANREKYRGSWRLDADGQLTLEIEDGPDAAVQIGPDQLRVSGSGGEQIFTRQP